MFSSEIRRDSLSSLLNKLERADEMKAHDANIPNVLLKHIETFRSDYSSNLERKKSLLQVATFAKVEPGQDLPQPRSWQSALLPVLPPL